MDGQDGRKSLMGQIVREQTGRIASEFARKGITVTTALSATGAAFMYATDQILVRKETAEGVRSVLRQRALPDSGEEVIEGVELINIAQQGSGRAQSVLEVIDEIDQRVGEGAAEPNYVLTAAPESGPCPATEPEPAYFDTEPFPGVREVDDDGDGRGVRIYVADTGLLADAKTHPWLKGVKGKKDPLDPRAGALIQPYCGHGTFAAGVARCLAPKAYVYVSNVFKVAGSALESDFVRDLAGALKAGYDIFNLSITTPSRKDLRLLGFEAWLRLADADPREIVCVAPAGNDGEDKEKFWPAAFDEVISVGALSADWHNRARFSNHGPWVKVYAPGRNLVNAYATGIYECQDAPYAGQIRRFYGMCAWSGTSFSTPVVAGLIADRKSRTGLSARKAAESLLADARTQPIPNVGPILLPYGNTFQI